MNASDAIKWVDNNKKRILKKAETYTSYTPYAAEDFLQDAYEAAIKAGAIVSADISANFESVFRVVHRQIVFKVTPYPEEGRYAHNDDGSSMKKRHPKKPCGGASMSFPSNQRVFTSLDSFHKKNEDDEEEVDLAAAYEKYTEPTLSKQEKVIMEQALGLTREGCLTSKEIGKSMGINGASVRKMIIRAIDKTRANVSAIAKKAQEPPMAKIRTGKRILRQALCA